MTIYPRVVSEAAAHTFKNKDEAIYQRGGLQNKRVLMNEDAINSLDSNGETFNFAYRHYGISKTVADGTWEAVVATEVKE